MARMILGWGNKRTKDYGEVIKGKCYVCDKEDNFKLIRIIDWVDLMFIPIIPYNIKYFLQCSNCNNLNEIKNESRIKLFQKIADILEKIDLGRLEEGEGNKEYARLMDKLLHKEKKK